MQGSKMGSKKRKGKRIEVYNYRGSLRPNYPFNFVVTVSQLWLVN